MSLFSLHEQWFLSYRPIWKIAISGHETWQLANVPEVVQTPFLPRRVEIELIFVLMTAVSEIRADFVWAWNLEFEGPKVAYVRSFYPQGVQIMLIFAPRAAVSEIRVDFQNRHIWA